MTPQAVADASPSPASGAPGTSGAAWLWSQVRLHVSRWAAGDFANIRATAGERALLAQPPLAFADPVVQDYLAWRRSMAWVALVFALAGIVDSAVDLFTSKTGGDTGLTGFSTFFLLLIFASRAWLGLVLVRSALGWADPRGGRRRLRWAWMLALFVPVLLVQLPLADLVLEQPAAAAVEGGEPVLGIPGLDPQAVIRGLAGIAFGVQGFVMALPGLTSLFPGAIRAGLLLKTLLPGRAMGAVVALSLGPIYALLLLVLMTFVQQAASSALFFIGALLLFTGPLLTFRRTWELVRPMSAEELAPRMARLRALARVSTWGGLGLLMLGLFTTKVFGHRLLGIGDGIIGLGDVALFAAWFLAMLTTYTVVSADGLLQTMRLAEQIRKDSEASAQFAADGAVLNRLEGAISLPATATASPPPGPGARPESSPPHAP